MPQGDTEPREAICPLCGEAFTTERLHRVYCYSEACARARKVAAGKRHWQARKARGY